MVATDPLAALLAYTGSAQADHELGNKCGKCQNHNLDISKKGK